MAEFTGTSGNDTFQNLGGSGSLVLVLAASSAGGIWPNVNILVNGAVVQSNVTVTADNSAGATQTVTVPVPSSATSVAINYTNDSQADWESGDRNVYIKSIALNSIALDPASASYVALFGDGSSVQKPGQADMVWGGTLTFSGASVTNAAAAVSVGTSDTFNGLAGLDTVVYSGGRAEFGIAMGSGGSLTVNHGVEADTMMNIERLQFSDMKHALDMTGNAGTVAKLLAAMWGESYLGAKAYVTVGLRVADQGQTALQIAEMAVNTAEFQQRAGSSSSDALVNTLRENLGYTGDVSGFLADLNAGRLTKAELAVMAADYMAATMSATSHAQLMGVMATGIDYL